MTEWRDGGAGSWCQRYAFNVGSTMNGIDFMWTILCNDFLIINSGTQNNEILSLINSQCTD